MTILFLIYSWMTHIFFKTCAIFLFLWNSKEIFKMAIFFLSFLYKQVSSRNQSSPWIWVWNEFWKIEVERRILEEHIGLFLTQMYLMALANSNDFEHHYKIKNDRIVLSQMNYACNAVLFVIWCFITYRSLKNNMIMNLDDYIFSKYTHLQRLWVSLN